MVPLLLVTPVRLFERAVLSALSNIMRIVSMIIQRMLLGRGTSTAGMESWDLGYMIAEDASSKAIYVPIWTSHYVNTDKVIIDWGDGSTSVIKGAYSGDNLLDLNPGFVHTYASAGSYRVKIYALPATWSRTEVGQSVNPTYGYTTNLTTIYNAMPVIRGAYVTYSDSTTTGKRMDNLFYGCSALTSIPSDLFSNNTDAETFNSTFHNCSSLSLTNDLLLFAGCSAAKEFRYTFCGVKGGVISMDFFADCVNATRFDCCFSGFSASQSPVWFPDAAPSSDGIMEGLFRNTSAESLMGTFALSSVPNILGLFDGCFKLKNINSCFYGAVIGEFYAFKKPYDGQPVKYNWYNLFDDCVNLVDITGLFLFAKVPSYTFVLPDEIGREDKWLYKAMAYPVLRFAHSPNINYADNVSGLNLTGETTPGRGTFDVIWLSTGPATFEQNANHPLQGEIMQAVPPGIAIHLAGSPVKTLSGKNKAFIVVPSGSSMETHYKSATISAGMLSQVKTIEIVNG
jgi:hypothetical protein